MFLILQPLSGSTFGSIRTLCRDSLKLTVVASWDNRSFLHFVFNKLHEAALVRVNICPKTGGEKNNKKPQETRHTPSPLKLEQGRHQPSQQKSHHHISSSPPIHHVAQLLTSWDTPPLLNRTIPILNPLSLASVGVHWNETIMGNELGSVEENTLWTAVPNQCLFPQKGQPLLSHKRLFLMFIHEGLFHNASKWWLTVWYVIRARHRRAEEEG